MAKLHNSDRRINVRLPDGLREQLAQLADANGRSMTAEVVAALKRHLEGVDRSGELWKFHQKHRENIERIPALSAALEILYNDISGSIQPTKKSP